MSRGSRFAVVLILLATLATSLANSTGAAPVRGKEAARPRSEPVSFLAADARGRLASDMIERVLATKADLQFTDTPLWQALDRVAERYDIRVILDTQALEDEGIRSDVPLALHVTGISLDSALRLLLDPLELTFMVRDEVLFVTTDNAAEEMLETRVYPVADLVDVSGANPFLITKRDSRFSALIEVIYTVIEPVSWDEVGGPGSVMEFEAGGSLAISQTREIHRQIEALLTSLREARDEQAKNRRSASDAATELVVKVFPLRVPGAAVHGAAATASPAEPLDESAQKAEPAAAPVAAADPNAISAPFVDVIVNMVELESWQANGGPGAIYATPAAIVVKNTDTVVRQVYQLLSAAGALAMPEEGDAGNFPGGFFRGNGFGGGGGGGGFGGGGFGGGGSGFFRVEPGLDGAGDGSR